VVSRCV